ncbi:MAG: 4-hydroxy-tetrahydrodipicolinate reductase [Clostridia bacterium]
MIKVLIWGIGGRLGKTVLECAKLDNEIQIVGGVDKFANPKEFQVPVFVDAESINTKVDLIIDFSRAEALEGILEYAQKNNTKLVLCTTGYTAEQSQAIEVASKKLAIFRSSNMSLGVNLLIELCKKASSVLGENFDIEIVEQHHNLKVDAPSGTAITIADAINAEFDNQKEFVYGRHDKNCRRKPREIGIHSIRGGTIVGKHDAMFIGNDEIITISHEAQSKAVFANGAIKAAKFLATTKKGLFNMQDLIETL